MPSRAAGRWWEPRDAGESLQVTRDASFFERAGDQARRDSILEIQGLSDTTRTLLAGGAGADLPAYDAALAEELDEILDRLDYYDYENRQETVNVRDGAWFSPEAVEAFSSEDVANPAVNCIDGDNATGWRNGNQNERHSIDLRLRSYPKKAVSMRFRSTGAPAPRQQFENIEVRAARGINGLDNDNNIVLASTTPVFPGGGTWVEIPWDSKKANARYIRISLDSADAQNDIDLREVEIRVETRNLGD